MQQLWLRSPSPAIRLWLGSGQLHWQLNPAAERLEHAPPLWRAWAQSLQAALAEGRDAGRLSGPDDAALAWAGGALEPGWLAWLQPAETASSMPPTDAVVRQLRQRLDITQRFGRLGIWERDLRTGQGQWDRYIYALYGLDPATATPSMEQAARLHFHPDDAQRSMDTWRRSIQQPGQYELHFRLYAHDGSLKSLHSMWEIISGADGKPERAIGVLLDDTESIELAQRHQASSLQLDLAVKLAGIVIWRRELGSDRIYLNDWGYRLLGLAPQPDGMSIDAMFELIHPDDRAVAQEAARQALERNDTVDLETRYRRADGSYLTMLSRRVAVRDAAGKPVALLGVNLDLTERRAAEAQLHSVEQRARLAAQATGLGTWERDLDAGCWYWDEQMYRLRGLESQDPRSLDLLHVQTLHASDRGHALARMEAAVHGRAEIYEDEYRVVWPDGSVRWLANRGMPQCDAQGRVHRVLGVNWDVTEHKHAEAALRDKVAAEQANRAKSEFLARMSHELRTPLNAVLGFARLLASDGTRPLDEAQRQHVARIETAGEHLLALIDDTLDLASIEAGTLPLKLESVPLAPMVAEALHWIESAAARAQVHLRAHHVAGSVHADARRLRQVLVNLLTNAVKYNRPGGRVDLRVFAPDDPAWLAIEVRDNGRGLRRDQLAHLFEPFNRLGAEREGIEGTGIGLSIVHQLVERMGGAIVVDSEPDQGACFTVWLPTAGAVEPDTQMGGLEPLPEWPMAGAASTMHHAGGSGSGSAPLDLLYIEDNAVNVLLVSELVALHKRWTLHVAEDGTSGVRRACELRPRLVLVDLQLPDFDGFEVLRRLRGQPGLEHTAFIALSANALPEDIERARASGFDDYWTKPIDFAQFIAGLNALAS